MNPGLNGADQGVGIAFEGLDEFNIACVKSVADVPVGHCPFLVLVVVPVIVLVWW